jgi:hypothetical protein
MHVARVRASVFATFATVASLFVSYVVLLILHPHAQRVARLGGVEPPESRSP